MLEWMQSSAWRLITALTIAVWAIASAAQTSSLDRARRLFDEKRWAEAASAFAEVERSQPGKTEALIFRARALDQLGSYKESAEILRSYLSANPQSGDAAYLLAHVLRHDHQLKPSSDAFGYAAQIRPPDGGDLLAMANNSIDLGDTEQALTLLEKATGVAPQSVDVRYQLGRVLYRQNRVQEAADSFQWVLDREPTRLGAYYNLGLCMEHQGQPERSLDLYRKAIEIDTKAAHHSQRPYLYMGALLSKLGRHADAIPLLQKALWVEPDCGRAHSELGRVYYALDRFVEAQQELEKAIIVDPHDSAAHYFLGRLYLRLGQRELAQKHFETTRELARKQAEGATMGMGRQMEMLPE